MSNFKIPVLISYWVLLHDKKNKMLEYLIEHKNRFRLIVDSGAFSAFTQKKKIEVGDYCDWVKSILIPASKKIQVDGYFQLDVIGDQESTKDNLFKSIKLKTNPIPIFTRAKDKNDLRYLDILISQNNWVGIGAIKGTAKSYPKWILDNCSDCSKLHLLGFADYDFITHYKPKSFDCSTWYNGGLYGDFFNPRTMKRITRTGRIDFKTAIDLGFQEKDIERINDSKYRSYAGLLMNAPQASACNAFLKYAIKFSKNNISSYFVVINAQQLEILDRAYEYFIEEKPINLFSKESRYAV